MPRGDGTGPNGMGSMTGRGLGFCNDENMNVNTRTNLGFGCGRGFGRFDGRGFGRGMGSRYFVNQNIQDNRTFLENQANVLKRQLDGVQKRLDDFDSKDND